MKNNLLKFLNKTNLSQKAFAEKMNVSEKTIGNLVSEKQEPKVGLALRIANYFNCSVKDLWIFPVVILLFIGISFFDLQMTKKGELVHDEGFFHEIEANEQVYINGF